MAKNFFAPFTGSLSRTGNIVETHIQNETLTDKNCTVTISLKNMDFTVLHTETHKLTATSLSAVKVTQKDYTELTRGIEDKVFVEAVFSDEEGNVSTEVEIFVRFKHLALEQPAVTFTVTEEEERYLISLKAERLACFTELDFAESDAIFSDNFFNLSGKEQKVIELRKADISGAKIMNARELADKLQVRTLYDTY
jgi:beta-mannosidase